LSIWYRDTIANHWESGSGEAASGRFRWFPMIGRATAVRTPGDRLRLQYGLCAFGAGVRWF